MGTATLMGKNDKDWNNSVIQEALVSSQVGASSLGDFINTNNGTGCI
jgi:hypothetical protein